MNTSFEQTIQVDNHKYNAVVQIAGSDINFKYTSYKGNYITLSVPYRKFEKLLNANMDKLPIQYTDVVEVRRPIPLFTSPPSVNYRTFEYRATIKRSKDKTYIKISDETFSVITLTLLAQLVAINSK